MNKVAFDEKGEWMVLEASTEPSSWAIYEGKKCLMEHQIEGRSSSGLIASIKDYLPKGFQAASILVGVGPGSFGGIRVAIASALGFRAAWGSEVKVMRSDDAVAIEKKDVSFLGVFHDARRGQYFVSYYEHGKMSRETKVIERGELENYLSKSTLAVSDGSIEGLEVCKPSAGKLAEAYMTWGREADLALEPIHLRPVMMT